MPQTTLEEVAQAYCKSEGLKFRSKVGEGAFKETFHVTSGRKSLALKIYKSGAQNERTRRELDALKRCDHRCIAKLYSVSEYRTHSRSYLTLIEEFCGGGTLGRQPPLSFEKCQVIGAELIEALGHIAELKLVHRDIKPENVMFRDGDDRMPVIVDFGLVRNLAETSITPSWAESGPGTPYFASPEQLNNEKILIDWRSDQFSLGVTLGYSTFGFHPFEENNEDLIGTVTSVSNREEPTSRFIEAANSSRLPTLIRMVAPWPVKRYRTPEVLATSWNKQEHS